MGGRAWWAAVALGGCALDPPVTAALGPPALLAPRCDAAGCVVVATAMPVGRPALAPRGWVEYCGRARDPACAGTTR